jgi:glycogen operon protein
VKDLYWMKPDGTEMTDADWNAPYAHCLGMGLPGNQITELGERGERITGETFLLLLNSHHEMVPFRLGSRRREVQWTCVFDSAAPGVAPRLYEHMGIFPLESRSFAVLRAERVAAER